MTTLDFRHCSDHLTQMAYRGKLSVDLPVDNDLDYNLQSKLDFISLQTCYKCSNQFNANGVFQSHRQRARALTRSLFCRI